MRYGKKTKISDDPKRPIYDCGTMFVQVNHHTRRVITDADGNKTVSSQCAITSGDVWYPITRAEAVSWLRDKKLAALAA